MRISFEEIKKEIQRCKEAARHQRYALGKKRESMASEALQELKREGLINDFLATTNLSWEDVMKGIDFFIVYVNERYKVCRLGVTGRGWVNVKKRQHPENQIIFVDVEESQESVKNKIIRAIAAQERERRWKS